MRRQLLAVFAILALAASPTWAINGTIGMYFDTDAALCQAAVPMGPPVRMYVYGILQGASQTGITGAEYKCQEGPNNLPDTQGYLFQETFDVNATVLGGGAFGNPDAGLRGINVAWADCQVGDGTKVLLETVDILNPLGSTDEMMLKIVKSDFYTNQFFKCPLFVLCDAPVYTKVCVGYGVAACQQDPPPSPPPYTSQCSTSGIAYINPIPGRDCRVGVSPTSWSTVKGLYSK